MGRQVGKPVLWIWGEEDFKKKEPKEGLLLKAVLFLPKFLESCALE